MKVEMERFLQRDDVLVRYNNNNNNSQRSFMDPSSSSSSTPRTSFRNTRNAGDGDGVVDFHDVFGGPPRRSSMHETRQSFNEATDLHSRRFRGDDGEASASSRSRQWSGLSERPVFGEEGGGIRRRNTIGDDGEASASSSSRQWSGLSERPVFGEEGGRIRRRNTSGDDFFDDIFRGDESSNSSTPRKIDRDMYSSIPVSRISSPARLLPPRAEPFSSSSLQAQFSLPTKFNQGIDFPTFASPTRSMYSNKDDVANGMNHPYSPSSPQSMFYSDAIQGLDESRNEAHPSYRQSPLSMEFSLKSDGSVKVTESETDTEGGSLKKDSSSSDVLPNSTQFHFSIYKWASKGVPQLIPLRNANGSKLKEKYIKRCSSSKGRIGGENMFMELPTKTLSDVKFSSPNDNVSANIESNGMVCKKQDIESPLSTSTQDKFEVFQSVKEVVLDVPKSEPLDSFQRSVENIPDNTVISNSREEKNPDSLPDTSLRGKEDEVINKFLEEASKPILRSLLSENNDEQGKAEIGTDVGGKESMAKPTKRSSGNFSIGRNLKNRGGKRTIHNGAEVDKASMQGSPVHMGHNLERNKIKGKVKEFVKIFNQEAPSKRVIEADTQSQSSRWKDAGTPKVEKEINISTVRADKTLPTPNMDKKKTSLNTSVKVDKIFKQSQKQDSGIDTTSLLFSDTSEQKDSLSSSVSDGSKAAPPSIDDFFHGNFSIEDISPDEDKLPQTGKDQEDFQASDAKIRQWSSGKEVNIRSLLSTLQYVLWPESGWKPVPLVDIIEGSAVKRAYQKALLCLHPDKLQQKGAAAHQKYVAEKVFDILQEAWIHFNSLGSL